MLEREYMKKKAHRANDEPSNNETVTETPALYTEPVEGWEKFPRDLRDALEGDELDFYDFGIVCYVLGAINWKTGVWKGTLGRMAEGMGWPFKDADKSALRKRLIKLRDAHWIEFESRQGQRSAYVIRLGERLKNGQRKVEPRIDFGRTSDSEGGTSSEVTLDWLSDVEAYLSDYERVYGTSQPRTNSPRQDRDSRRKTEDGRQKTQTGEQRSNEGSREDEKAPLGNGYHGYANSDADIPFGEPESQSA